MKLSGCLADTKASKNYILDWCLLPRLTFWDHKMKTPHTSHGILELNYKSPPCLIWILSIKLLNNPLPITMTEYLPYFIVKFKIKCLPASWLRIAFSDTDLMLQFCLPYLMAVDNRHISIFWVVPSSTINGQLPNSTTIHQVLTGKLAYVRILGMLSPNLVCRTLSAHYVALFSVVSFSYREQLFRI